MPDEPTALGLLALLLLHDARRLTRTDDEGHAVLLVDQDRTRWDPSQIREGVELLGAAFRLSPDRPDRYAAEAAIAACHALAPSYDETDWGAIVSWYDVLVAVQDSPVVRLNRAVAVAERDGPRVGLALVDGIDGLDGYPWWHATRAELLSRSGDESGARDTFHAASPSGRASPWPPSSGVGWPPWADPPERRHRHRHGHSNRRRPAPPG